MRNTIFVSPVKIFIKYILSLLCTMTVVISVFGQDNYRVVNWNVEQGLSNGFIRCMIKDQFGFLWIGTQAGLNRFDGNSFRIFLPNEKDRTSLPNKNIRGIIEDSLHNIWVGTDEGLSRYDIKTDTFTNISLQAAYTESDYSFIPFWASKNEIFCLEAHAKITVIDIHSLKIVRSVAFPHQLEENTRNQDMIYDHSTQSVWRLPDNNEATGGGIYKLNLITGREEHLDWPCFRKIQNHYHWSEGMCYDKSRNSIWINDSEGLMQFDLNNKQFHYVDAAAPFHIQAPGIGLDSNKRVWVGTNNHKIYIYNPAIHTVTIPFPNDSALQEAVNDRNLKIYCDRDGMTWVVYYTQRGLGVNQLIPYSPAVYRYSNATDILSRAGKIRTGFPEFADDGKLYFSMGNELHILDTINAALTTVKYQNLRGIDPRKNYDFLAVSHTGKRVWLVNNATFDLYQADIPTLKCKPVVIENELGRAISGVSLNEDYGVYFIRKFKNNFILWGVNSDKSEALFLCNPDSALAREIINLHDAKAAKIIVDQNYIHIKIKNRKNTSFTYSCTNGKFVKIKTPLDSLAWTAAASDSSDGGWWIANSRGILHLTKDKPEQTYSIEHVVPPGTDIYGIVKDHQGNIWFNTNLHLASLNIKTGKILNLSINDGFRPQEYLFTSFPALDKNSNIYVSGLGYEGRDIVDLEKLRQFYPPSYVYIKKIEVNQQFFDFLTSPNNIQEMNLDYFQNKIDIETGIIDFFSKGGSRLRYKLEGKDNYWQYGSYYNAIRYEGLPAGTYKLIMQASNTADEFNGPEKILNIHISAAYWTTWWFRMVAILSIFGLILLIVQYRSRQLKEKNLQLEEKVMHRTSELKLSLEELKTTQDQLIQREKMASLGELTAGIAHEIQNPLNFVNNFSEVNTELIEELKDELKKLPGNHENETALLSDIQQNEIKIVQHGKRADAIVKNMLQHSRSSSTQKELTNLNSLAEEYLRLSYHGFRGKDKSFNASIETRYGENIPNINVLPQEIGRVLLNLFNNAFYSVYEKEKKEGKQFHPIVSVSTKKNDTWVEIKIRDNGLGIPQNISKKIFQPFFTTKPTGEGTGLGLSLSYDIITKAHGGNLIVESLEGEFAEFIISLPL